MIADELIEICATDHNPFSILSEDSQWFVLEVADAYGLYMDFTRTSKIFLEWMKTCIAMLSTMQ